MPPARILRYSRKITNADADPASTCVQAIRCYERAESNDDREGIALQELARLHHESGNDAQAATCYARNLALRDAQQLEGSDTIEALKFLAEHCKRKGELDKAEPFCTRLLDCGGPQVARAPCAPATPKLRQAGKHPTAVVLCVALTHS